MAPDKIAMINELFKKSKTPDGLTAEELELQAKLREEYRRGVVANLSGQLDILTKEDA